MSELTQRLEQNFAQAAAELTVYDWQKIVYVESGWRVHDIVSHLLAWDTEVAQALQAYHQGSNYHIADFELQRFNQASYEKWKNWTAEQVLNEGSAVRARVTALVAQFSSDELTGEMTYPSGRRGRADALIEEIMEHQREHFADIHA